AIATTVPTADASVDGVLDQIPDGDYTVRLTRTSTNCSALVSFSIADGTVNPTINSSVGTDITVTNNTACDGATPYPNGAITVVLANVVNGSGTYTFEWYYGSSINAAQKITDGTNILVQKGTGTGTGVVAGATTNSISNLDAGAYTVRLIDSGTGCTSNEVTVNIVDDIPSITMVGAVVSQDDFSCDVSSPTGAVEANITTYDGGPVANNAGFTIEWYSGSNTFAANLLPAAVATATATQDAQGNDHIIENLPDGTYTAKIINNTSNCFETKTVTVNRSVPTVSANIQEDNPQTTCVPLDGAASSNPTIVYSNGTPTGLGTPTYTYQWYDGQDTSTPLGGETNQTLTARAAGYYTVVATETNSGCVSNPETIEIQDNISSSEPTLTSEPDAFSIIPNSCDATDGEISVTITNNPTVGGHSFSFEWYKGSDNYAENPGTQITTGQTYATLKFVNPVPNGTTPTTIDYTNLAISTFGPGNQITGGTSGSQIDIISDNGSQLVLDRTTNIGGFSFLFNEQITDGTSGATADITQFNSGAFAVGETITETFSGGTAEIVAIDYNSNELFLTNVVGTIAVNQPISGPSGTATIGANASDYAQYTTTVSSTSGTFGTTTISNIESGLYTVVMIDGTTGCRYQRIYDLPFLGQQATTTIAISHVDECPDNGSATVGLADKFVIAISGLSGTFAEDEVIVGQSSGAQARISRDNGANLDVSLISGAFGTEQILGQTSGATANIANAGTDITELGYSEGAVDDISEYDIYLYAGNGVPADPYAYYTVDGLTFPQILSGAALAPGAELTFDGLPAGFYTAIAREIADPAFNPGSSSRCWSAAATDEIEQRAYEPLLDQFTITNNTICDPVTYGGNGGISVTAKKNADDVIAGNDFNITWYEGTGGGKVFIKTDANVVTSNITNRAPGDYTVLIERLGLLGPTVNGCELELVYTIQTDPEQHSISSTSVTHITDCGGTGTISIGDTDITDNAADYTYTWYKGTYPGGVIAAQNSATLSGQTAGTYFVEAIADNNNKGCQTPVFEVEILDNTSDPVVNLTLGNKDSSCESTADIGNGSINFSITSASAGDYSYQWYSGASATPGSEVTGAGITGISGTVSGPYTGTLDGIDAGTYTIEITDNTSPDNNCSVVASFDLAEDEAIISITSSEYTLTPSDNCTVNGAYEITDVLEDGASQGLTNYTFTWNAEGGGAHGGTLASTGAGTNNKLEDLQPGDYQVLITNTVTECTSSLIYFTIDNQAVDPVIVLTASSDDTSCKAGNVGNGLLTIGVENGVGTTTTTGYTFTWYRSTTTSAVNQITAPAGGNAGSATVSGSGIDNLSADTYTVVVTDTSDPNNACTTTASFVLGEDQSVISITSSEYTLTPSDNCTVNGAYEITNVLEDGASQGLANYSF
ncbi:MAG: hypothetical protein RIG77_10460, partial [Cyclobacteriaceae bacterium]